MTKDEALKLEFEEWFEKQYGHKPMPNTKHADKPHPSVYMTMFADGAWRGWKASKEALEQPAQEPYCWTVEQKNGLAQGSMCRTIEECKSNPLFDAEIDHIIPLYTHPHQWQGLTDDEIGEMYDIAWIKYKGDTINVRLDKEFARAIEAKLKEKNYV